jgi:hypothetical protein
MNSLRLNALRTSRDAMARTVVALMEIVEEMVEEHGSDSTVEQIMIDAENTLLAAGVMS